MYNKDNNLNSKVYLYNKDIIIYLVHMYIEKNINKNKIYSYKDIIGIINNEW